MSTPFGRKPERKCSVPECKAKVSENTVFHKFPNDANRREDWIRACNITINVTVDSLICGYHFTRDDYISDINSRLRGLKPTAVPRPNLLQNVQINTPVPYKQISPTQARRKCSVPQCTAVTDERRSFHTVPKDEKVKKQWVRACGIGILSHPYAYVCSAHFERADFITGPTSKKQVLRPDAFPSLNLPDKRPVMKTVDPMKVLKKDNPINKPMPVNTSQFEAEEKVTTIIYVPENCATNIISGGTLKNSKIVINKQDNLNLSNKNVFSQVQNSVTIPSIGNANMQGRISSTQKIAVVKNSVALPKPTKPVIKVHSPNSKTVQTPHAKMIQSPIAKTIQSSNAKTIQSPNAKTIQSPNVKTIQSPNAKNVQSPNTKNVQGKVIVQVENVNETVNQGNSNNNVSPQTNNVQGKLSKFDSSLYKKTIIRQGVSAVTLCADCGQYCKIEDEDLLYKSYKNAETLAAELLLELQELNLSNEDERILLTRKGIEICNKAILKQSIDLMELLTNDNELMAFTGINFELLDKLTQLVSNVEGISSVRHTTPAKTRIVICLCKLRVNLSFACLGMLFGTTQQLCASNFFAMLKTLSVLLEKTIHWPKTEELLKGLPECFQSFKQTRVILNCSETQIDKQRCSNCQQKLAEGIEKHQVVKLVLGVAPSGLIIFKSNVFESDSADVSVFKQTNVMDKLNPQREAIMADNSLKIEAECAENNVTLIKLPKLGKNKQFSKHDVELIKNISTARIHVDRTIHRFRMYKIMQAKVHWRILPYLDDVCTVIAGIVNMKNPIPPNEIDFKSVAPIRK